MRKFISTRNKNNSVTSKEAIIKGLSEDGGLYTPTDLQDIKIDLNKCLYLNYQELASYILSKILDDYSEEELNECISKAYTKTFKTNDITPTSKIGKDFMVELYNGPTSAFKDVALTLLPHLLKTAYKSKGLDKKIYILTSTSGDTGKAALEAFKNVEDTYITVFYPLDGVSYVQERQMNTTTGNNVDVVSVEGNFDDCQRMQKECNDDIRVKEACKNVQLSSANSINLGRLVPQIVYYFKGYVDLVKNKHIKLNDKVNFIVPTGNFGNILAGYLAKQLGCPINKLVCASNKNNILTDFINTGIYDKNRDFYTTMSPSMDILVSSNLERLLFILSDFDDEKIKTYMNELNTKGRYQVDEKLLQKLQENFVGIYCSEENCTKTMYKAYHHDNRLIDPHTAIAYYASGIYNDKYKNIILSTASPYKFSNSVFNAITNTYVKNEMLAMKELNKITKEDIPNNLKNINELKTLHNKTIKYEEGIDYVIEKINQLND